MPLDQVAKLSDVPMRANVEALETHLLSLPQTPIPLIHGFGPGFYARSIAIPAGTVLTGMVHKTDHIFMVTHGEISLTTDEGVVRVCAPYQAICKAGAKRAGFAHTDVVCVNIHITDETDVPTLEAMLVEAPALTGPAQED